MVRLRKSLRCRGATLVEVAIAAVVITVSALGLSLTFGVQRGRSLNARHTMQAVALANERLNCLIADLSLGDDSPLVSALPLDFTQRYVTASGTPAAPWNTSTSEISEDIALGSQNGYCLRATVQYFDDSADDSDPTDTDPYDALKLCVDIVPETEGNPNPHESVVLETYWYRQP